MRLYTFSLSVIQVHALTEDQIASNHTHCHPFEDVYDLGHLVLYTVYIVLLLYRPYQVLVIQ